MTMSPNMVQNVKRVKSEKPNPIKIAKRKSERKMVAVRKVILFNRPMMMKLATQIMRRQKRGAVRKKRKNNYRRQPVVVVQLIPVSCKFFSLQFSCIFFVVVLM